MEAFSFLIVYILLESCRLSMQLTGQPVGFATVIAREAVGDTPHPLRRMKKWQKLDVAGQLQIIAFYCKKDV